MTTRFFPLLIVVLSACGSADHPDPLPNDGTGGTDPGSGGASGSGGVETGGSIGTGGAATGGAPTTGGSAGQAGSAGAGGQDWPRGTGARRACVPTQIAILKAFEGCEAAGPCTADTDCGSIIDHRCIQGHCV